MMSFLPLHISAVGAYPFPMEIKQPNGETITIRIHGNENFHYITTEGNYVIIENSDNAYVYAEIDNEGLIKPGKQLVTNSLLKSQQSNLITADSPEFKKIAQQTILKNFEINNTSLRSSNAKAISGNIKGLVILVNFTDKAFTVSQPLDSFSKMLNQVGYSENGGTGSARDFYMDNSAGTFIPQFDVYGPVDLPNNMEFYGENNGGQGQDKNPEQMIVDACNAANGLYPNLNFADYDNDKNGVVDNVFVFYAGYNEAEGADANTIWPHKYSIWNKNLRIDGVRFDTYACTSELRGKSGSNMAGIGTFTHEFGHVLGLPDIYDADGDINDEGPGVGYWSTMDTGPYLNNGRTPPYFSAVERNMLGWITPVTLTSDNDAESITINPISSANPQSYRINTPTNDEYFILESRKKEKWDIYLPAEGMLIYHVDETKTANKTIIYNGAQETRSAYDLWIRGVPNIIGDHQCMKLIPANNEQPQPDPQNNNTVSYKSYAGHPFPGSSTVTSISDDTTPGLLSWNNEKSRAGISSIVKNNDGSVSFTFNMDKSAGLNKVISEKPVIYTENNTVYVTNISEKTSVEVYDIAGRLYLSKTLKENSGNNMTINTSGIYIVKLNTNNEIYSYKVLIK